MNYRLSTWKHPTTGQIRIYIRGLWIMPEDKCFMFKVDARATNPGGIEARMQSSYYGSYTGSLGHHFGNNPADIGMHFADLALSERGWRDATFDSIIAAIEGRGEIEIAPPYVHVPTQAEIDRAELIALIPASTLSIKERFDLVKKATKRAKAHEDILRAFANLKWSKARLKADRKLENEVIARRFAEHIGCDGMDFSLVEIAHGRLGPAISKLEKV